MARDAEEGYYELELAVVAGDVGGNRDLLALIPLETPQILLTEVGTKPTEQLLHTSEVVGFPSGLDEIHRTGVMRAAQILPGHFHDTSFALGLLHILGCRMSHFMGELLVGDGQFQLPPGLLFEQHGECCSDRDGPPVLSGKLPHPISPAHYTQSKKFESFSRSERILETVCLSLITGGSDLSKNRETFQTDLGSA